MYTASDWSCGSTQLPERMERFRSYLKAHVRGEVDDRLTDALERLWYDGAFADRTRVRSDTSWREGGSESAREILGDDETWHLVVEVVDTLYNRVLADSLQITAAALSTPPGIPDDRLHARAVAQRIALDSDLRGEGEHDERRASTAFEYRIDAASLTPASFERVAKELLSSQHLDQALAALLEARRPSNREFWVGVGRVRDAHRVGDLGRLDSTIHEHLGYVSGVMGRAIQVRPGFLRGASVAFTAGVAKEATAVSAAAATTAAGAPPWMTVAVLLGVAGAVELGDNWWKEHPRCPANSATFGALTEVIQPARENP